MHRALGRARGPRASAPRCRRRERHDPFAALVLRGQSTRVQGNAQYFSNPLFNILGAIGTDRRSIVSFQIYGNTGKLELVHKTPVDEYPGALAAFNGRLLAGVGRMLRLYDIGRRKLLRKCENRHIPSLIVDIKTIGQRVFVSDVQESVFCVKYKKRENQLIIFADDTNPRWITNTCILDYDTVAMSDKFGNVAVLRLPQSVSDDVDEDPTGNKALWDRGN